MSAPSTSGLSVELLLRVIDVKYGRLTILYYTILYYTILYYTTLHYTTLYCTVLYCTVLYYTILYYTILYYTNDLVILFSPTLLLSKPAHKLPASNGERSTVGYSCF